MKKMICDKGHFYDGDKYDSCPTCRVYQEHQIGNTGVGGGAAAAEPSRKSKEKEKNRESHSKKGWLSGLLRSGGNTLEMPSEEMEIPGHIGETMVLPDDEQIQIDSSNALEQAAAVKGSTVALWQEEAKTSSSFASEIEAARQMAASVESTVPPQLQRAFQPVVQAAPMSSADTSSGKTVAFYGMEDEPVTGFLICVHGESKGTSYTLKTGQNFIGRGLDMDVILNKEPSVSRVKHAIILFDPKKREFYLQPGESSGLTYLNGDLVMNYCKLSVYDTIQLGDCVLAFLPFCGERFSWD